MQCVAIFNIINVISILDNIKCEALYMFKESLSGEETQALVQAMESRVERVDLRVGKLQGVSVYITALQKYSGGGKCHTVKYIGNINRNGLRSWKQWQWRIIRIHGIMEEIILTRKT